MSSQPFTWLVVTTIDDAAEREPVPLGRAVFDNEADLLTVSSVNGQPEVPEVRGLPMTVFARMVLS